MKKLNKLVPINAVTERCIVVSVHIVIRIHVIIVRHGI